VRSVHNGTIRFALLEYQVEKFSQNREVVFGQPLSFQLANGLHVRHVIKNYEPKDMESGAAATLLEWINIHYEKDPQARKFDREVRVGTVQWQMRPAATLWSFCRQMAAFGYFGEYVLINKLP